MREHTPRESNLILGETVRADVQLDEEESGSLPASVRDTSSETGQCTLDRATNITGLVPEREQYTTPLSSSFG